jgi:hypothetical protein
MARSWVRVLPPLLAAVFAATVAARSAAAQQPPWAPAPPTAAQPAPSEGGGVGLQILAAGGIGGAAVGTMALALNLDSRLGGYVTWGLVAVTPAALGLAVCNLGVPSDRREPSCPRAVVAAYIGSLIAIPVLLVAVLTNIDWGNGPNPHETRAEAIIIGATSVAWVGGMTLGATVFGRRRIRAPAHPPAAPPPQPAVFVPADDPRQPRWAAARSAAGQLVFRLLSFDF